MVEYVESTDTKERNKCNELIRVFNSKESDWKAKLSEEGDIEIHETQEDTRTELIVTLEKEDGLWKGEFNYGIDVDATWTIEGIKEVTENALKLWEEITGQKVYVEY